MSEVWTRWQGHVVNGTFPLGRYLGCSDHSGVFLTKSAGSGPSELAIKLLPADRALAESQLPRWKRAAALPHPHLLRLLEWGGCQLEGLPYLYNVTEYADQTLAQLLLHRALTDEEAREMLLPALDALAFLHGRSLLQGQPKPTNILVVGDQLKLAIDTIRRISDGTVSSYTPTVYDAPEARRHGSSSTAGDIWGLGVTLYEALTRRPPAGLGESREAVVLPPDFSPAFRDVVTRCLSPNPQDRPSATELVAWAGGRSAGSAPVASTQPVVIVQPEPRIPELAPSVPTPPNTASPPVAPVVARPAPSMAQPPKPRALPGMMLGAVVILALVWIGARVFRSHPAPVPPPAETAAGSLAQAPAGAASSAAKARAPVSAVSATKPSDAAASPSALHEVIPEVSRSARQTILGHIKVWVRVTVEQDGTVSVAAADRGGPSKYFQRLAIEAAKKWTFAPADMPTQRLMQVRFDFSRDGTTARAVAVH